MATATLMAAGMYADASSIAREWRARSADSYESVIAYAGSESRNDNPQEALSALELYRADIIKQSEERQGDFRLLCASLIAAGRVQGGHDLIWPKAQLDRRWLDQYVAIGTLIPQRQRHLASERGSSRPWTLPSPIQNSVAPYSAIGMTRRSAPPYAAGSRSDRPAGQERGWIGSSRLMPACTPCLPSATSTSAN